MSGFIIRRFKFGSVAVDVIAHETTANGVAVALSETEQALIEVLARAQGKPVASAALHNFLCAWRGESLADSTVKVHICNARKKLAAANGGKTPIESLTGAYVMRNAPEFARELVNRPRFARGKDESVNALKAALSAIVNAPSMATVADDSAVELAANVLRLAAQWLGDTTELTRNRLAIETARLESKLESRDASPVKSALVALTGGFKALAACQYGQAKRLAALAVQAAR